MAENTATSLPLGGGWRRVVPGRHLADAAGGRHGAAHREVLRLVHVDLAVGGRVEGAHGGRVTGRGRRAGVAGPLLDLQDHALEGRRVSLQCNYELERARNTVTPVRIPPLEICLPDYLGQNQFGQG